MASNAVESTTMNGNTTDDKIDPAIAIGQFYAHPPPGEEICISGISGAFPNSANMEEFKENLFNKVDMVCDDERRWNKFHPEIPQRTGKIYNAEKFDPGFFGLPHRHVESMDPMLRLILEKCIECVMDAGMNPSELQGTRTGVYMGVCFGESEREIFYQDLESRVSPMLGVLRSAIAHRISHFLKVKGPSYVADTACSSALFSLENAYRNLRDGVCDMAIVGGCNLCLHPFVSLQFARLGVLSTDGACKSFDETGNGYCRSEAVTAIFLQKAKDSRRIYAKLIHAKTNCDGFKELGISYPSGKMQMLLLEEFYEECGLDPSKIGFVEAHGTGTKVGDPEEGETIDNIFCTNRDQPLYIGSVKSNIGHSESASGVVSIAKCIIAMEEGYLPPNIHYTSPRKEIKGLVEGRMKVVTEKIPIPYKNGTMALSSFGFGGANAHVLLEWNHKEKQNGSKPTDDIPRLICVSGRSQEAISSLLNHANEKFDAEHIQLLHEIFKKNINCHIYRGFSIVSKSGPLLTSSKRYSENEPDLLITFGDFGSRWQSFAKSLLTLPVFAKTIQSIHQILIRTGVNISDILQNSRTLSTHSVVNNILGTLALQIGIIEILRSVKIQPNAIMGHATGEIACAYFEGFLTLEQAVLTALEIGNHLKDISKPTVTYVVKFVDEKDLKNLPNNIEITWKYSDNSAALSGEPKAIHQFVEHLEKKGADIYEIGSIDVTTHSKSNAQVESSLLQKLRVIIPGRKLRSGLWLSTSNEKNLSAEYFVKSLYSQVNTGNVASSLRDETVVLEFGLGRVSALLNHARSKPLDVISLEENSENTGLVAFLGTLGKVYESGFQPQIQNLYPKLPYPVSRGTPMISNQIKWEHSENWHVMRYSDIKQTEYGEMTITVNPKEEEWSYLTGHIIDGRNLYPATGYIDLVWETFSATKRITKTEMNIVIENCKLSRATALQEQTIFIVEVQKNSGNFEVIEGRVDIVSGTIRQVDDDELEQLPLPLPADEVNHSVPKLDSHDIYKELRLRGYHYKGDFRMVEGCNSNATKAFIKWNGNWVSFMDNMLQIQILQLDTRLLYVPTGFKRITIRAKEHLKYVESFGENPILPVYIFKDAGVIRCGGIEIRGLTASSITRRKQAGEPVLEKYEFMPNEATLSLTESLRINVQIALENLYAVKINVAEIFDDSTKEAAEPLGPLIYDALCDQPLIQANITIFTQRDVKVENVNIEREKTLSGESDCLLVVGTQLLQKPNELKQAFGALKEKGFILSREELDYHRSQQEQLSGVEIVTVHRTENEKLVFFRKSEQSKKPIVIEISDKDVDFNWLAGLQRAMKSTSNIVVYAQNEDINGLLGFYNCLRREAGGTNVQCFLIYGNDAPPFDINNEIYRNQLRKNLSVNIFKDGKWGTYRHLLMKEFEEVECEHCFVNQTTRGDLSSLKMTQGPLTSQSKLSSEKILIQVYFASINFRDIMTASGRINVDVITSDRIEQECVQGFEYSGKDPSGKRVMGLSSAALSTLVTADRHLMFEVPDEWSLEQAATVPAVYTTVLYALFVRGNIKRGESILIHSGTGGIGQAAINVALAHGCRVFTTVGTPEKREFLKKLFPQLLDHQIGNSRDLTFETMVKNGTGGRGVDVVLNSLAEEKLIASVRCLAMGGRFLEIGKFDLVNDNRLALMLVQKECSFHGVMLDKFFDSPPHMKKMISSLLTKGLKDGIIKPLTTNIFQINEVEEAFRFMATGKHTGKVLIQIRKEETQKNKLPTAIRKKAVARFNCDPEKSYVVLGGLGGFGLEMADWLMLRGAKKLILNSRNGVRTGYQAYRLKIWRSYGVTVHISTADITTREGCETLITEAEKLGPVDGLFNLAVVLRDSILENQSPESFSVSFGPKTTATKYLDDITRRRCLHLRHFVIFSSVSCGRGNAGQVNYGMANSAMERICERRRKAGYPALAIQWGAVGDVGLVAEMQKDHVELDIGGTLQQRISSCLQVLDTFLCQKQATIVSSIVVAEKRRAGSADNIVDATALILGIKLNAISHHSTLAELGLDSMTAVEIKQTLEREFEVFLSAQEIRNLTFAKLQELQDARANPTDITIGGNKISVFELLIQNMLKDPTLMEPVVRLPSLAEDTSDAPILFAFPGVDGFVDTFRTLALQLKAEVIGLQCRYKVPPVNFITTVEECLEQMTPYLKPNEIINIVAYSWGTLVALEVIARLEKEGRSVNLILIDGSPAMMTELVNAEMKAASEEERYVMILCRLMLKFLPPDVVLSYSEVLSKCSSEEERLDVFMKATAGVEQFPDKFRRTATIVICARVMDVFVYKPTYGKINASVKLFKPSSPLFKSLLPEDYNLSNVCNNSVEIQTIEGDHVSMLENPSLAERINEMFSEKMPKVIQKAALKQSTNIRRISVENE